jgi:signal transduction histidine kinase
MRFQMRDRSVAEITTKAIRANEGYAEKFSVHIQLAPIDPQLLISVDEECYIQVLSNLLSNAAKFSPTGGTIDVTSEIHGGRVRICVADQGPGIPAEFRSRIFGKFSQADSSAARRVGGTGLGLHIARQMVERMGGAIGFETESGRGTTFWIEFQRLLS